MKVSALFVHPIKSCRGIRVEHAHVTDRGLAHDRRFMIVDDTGMFFTQRTDSNLQRVATSLEGEMLSLDVPGFGTMRMPLDPPDGETKDVVVWRSQLRAAVHAEGSAFFTACFGRPLSLVYMREDLVRGVNPTYGRPTDRTSFADGYPFLLLSDQSISDLSARVGEAMVVERFRPNIVVDGDEPFVEDRMTSFTIANVRFHGVKPCERCVITTIDPETLEAGKEPLRTLAKYRRGVDGGVLFGMNLVHDGTGEVRVGDAVVNVTYSDRS